MKNNEENVQEDFGNAIKNTESGTNGQTTDDPLPQNAHRQRRCHPARPLRQASFSNKVRR